MSMSGKFLYLISDDPPLEKTRHIGCMAGILQLFDRHHFRSLHGNKRITEGRSSNSERVENNDDDDPRGSIDSSKLPPRRMLAFRNASEIMSDEVSESEFPYRLSPGLRNRSHRRTSSTESVQIPWQPEDESVENSRMFMTARSRYSCDGRDISRPTPAVDHRDAYRSSSLRALEFPRLSVGVMDSPARRPSNIVAKLMGLDDMPDSPLQASKAPEPAPTPAKPLSRASSAPSSPRPLAAKILLDMIHQPTSLPQAKLKSLQPVNRAQDNTENPARFDGSEKLDPNFSSTAKIPSDQSSSVDAELQASSDKAGEAVKICTCSATEVPAVKPVEKFGSSCPVTNESGASSSRSSSRAPQKNQIIQDQMASNIITRRGATKNSGDDLSSKRSKPIANKTPQEISNAGSTHKPSPRYRSEISPQRLPKDDAKEKGKRKGMEIRPDRTNIKKDEDSLAARRIQSSKTKRSLDFSPKSRRERVSAKGTNQACKAEQKITAKPCEKEVFPDWLSEDSSEASEEPLDMAENTILPKDEEQNLMHFTQNILQKPKHGDSFHYTSKSQSNDRKVRDFVTECFTACGLLIEGEEEKDISEYFYCPGNFSMGSEIFHELEKKYIKDEEADAQRINLRLLFDTVNEVLRRKSAVPPYSRFPQRGRNRRNSRLSGRDLVNSVVGEIESLTNVEWGDVFNGICKLLDNDLEMSCSIDADAMEVGEVVLDVERGIFRDLMDDLLRDLLS